MKSSIMSLALVALLLALCLCQIQANEADKTTTTPASYFGVDANDAEAVRAKQRELNEDKFKELFGEEAHEQFKHHEESDHEPSPGSGPLNKVVDMLKQGYDMLKKKLSDQKGDQIQK